MPIMYLAYGLAPEVPPAPPMISGPIFAVRRANRILVYRFARPNS